MPMVLPGMYPEDQAAGEIEEIKTTPTHEDMKHFLRIVKIERIEPPLSEQIRLEYPIIYRILMFFSKSPSSSSE